MTTEPKESVRQILADLHAHRVKTMDPAVLQLNIEQRRTLVDTADRAGFVKPGDHVEPFSLANVDGGEITLDDALAEGPLVLIFFRFAGCPACNLALPYYQRQLWPELQRLGAGLVAVSPHVPEGLIDIKLRHGFEFDVASDREGALARRFGLPYTFNEASKAAMLSKGSHIRDITGTEAWEFPMPAVVVIGQDRVVRFVDVSPDWMARTEAEPVIEAVRELALVAAQ